MQALLDRLKRNVTDPDPDNVYKSGMTFFGAKPNVNSEKLAEAMALDSYKQGLKPQADTSSPLPTVFVDVRGKAEPDPTYVKPTANKPMSSYGVSDTDMQTPEEHYQSLNPENRALIDKVSNYDVNPMSIPGMNNQARTELLKLVSALHPDYQQANYATKAGTLKDFASGNAANQVQALNTATKHSGRIAENMKGLNNFSGAMAPLNAPKNFLMDTFGGGGPKSTALSINATFDELATALKKSGATDITIKGLKDRINENMSPEAQQSVLADMANLLSDQESSLQNRYEQGTFGKHKGSFFDPYGQDVLSKLKGSSPVSNNQPPQEGGIFNGQKIRKVTQIG